MFRPTSTPRSGPAQSLGDQYGWCLEVQGEQPATFDPAEPGLLRQPLGRVHGATEQKPRDRIDTRALLHRCHEALQPLAFLVGVQGHRLIQRWQQVCEAELHEFRCGRQDSRIFLWRQRVDLRLNDAARDAQRPVIQHL